MRNSAVFSGGLLILLGFILVLNNLGLQGDMDVWGLMMRFYCESIPKATG